MLQTYCAESPIEIRIFWDLGEARLWLGLTDAADP
jgi:hypothetical protein